jgi:hypothetical protein
MTSAQADIILLAKEIYLERISHLTSSDWDFRPVAKKAISMSEEFFKAAAEVFAPPPPEAGVDLTVPEAPPAPATVDPAVQAQVQDPLSKPSAAELQAGLQAKLHPGHK